MCANCGQRPYPTDAEVRQYTADCVPFRSDYPVETQRHHMGLDLMYEEADTCLDNPDRIYPDAMSVKFE